MSDSIRDYKRNEGYRYFVRGLVKPRSDQRVPTDFGDGIYAWDDDADGLSRALTWANRKSIESRVVTRLWPSHSLLDVPSQRTFERFGSVKFVSVRRLRIGQGTRDGGGRIELWHDAFGLNVFIQSSGARRLLSEVRSAFYLTPYATLALNAA